MLVGVISDTHGNLPLAVHEAFAGVERIIHAGDIGASIILDELSTIAPVTAVLGNCDRSSDYHEPMTYAKLTLASTSVLVIHTPEHLVAALRGHGDIAPGEPLPQLCIHGHTHIPRDERAGAVRILCPGSPTRPRGGSSPSVLVLDLNNGRVNSKKFVTL